MQLEEIKFKSKFLQKKNEEKKKLHQNTAKNNHIKKLVKNIRSFLTRAQIVQQAKHQSNVKMLILLKHPQQIQNIALIRSFIQQQNGDTKDYYIKKIMFFVFEDPRLTDICESLMMSQNAQTARQVLKDNKFINLLSKQLQDGKGSGIFQLCVNDLYNWQKMKLFNKETIFNILMKQFRTEYMQVQGEGLRQLSIQSIILLSAHLQSIKYQINTKQKLSTLEKYVEKLLINISQLNNQQQMSLVFGIQLIFQSVLRQSKQIIQMLKEQNKQLLALVQDDQEIQYIENKIRQHLRFSEFSNNTLQYLERFFNHPKLVYFFSTTKSEVFKRTIVDFIKQLNRIFDQKKLYFLKEILSSNSTLQSLLNFKQPMFFESLKIRIQTMDDEQFEKSNLFTVQQWKQVIKDGLKIAVETSKRILLNAGKQKKVKDLFLKKNDDDILLKNLSFLLSNLHKKCLRTKKIPENCFVNQQLNNQFGGFAFGIGLKTIQIMLKHFPFAFTFQTRLNKLRQFIKEDKQNYDRTLFLQEEVDPGLIIQVRRGYEFMDAFQACMQRDLRKKYKIVFFNEQGLEEQGVDGGGIIKQFINRVLKVSFSEVYDLFYQTPDNELIPNPDSTKVQQYQFIGKIVGKAVYEGITIDPKFAQPFLNLLIGRENTFEDLQYLDKKIYKSLLQIKKMGKEIEQLYQTFTILDERPNGSKKYVDLLSPDKIPSKQVFLNEENKLAFIMAYTDYKCNRLLREKTRLFRQGFLKVMKPEWLTMFSNQELNMIISGGTVDFSVDELKLSTVYNDYNDKHPTIKYFWETLKEFTVQQKSLFLLYVTSCSRPPTLGFEKLKPHFCIANGGDNINNLPTANTCMNVLRLPHYPTKNHLKNKLLYAIKAKAGFQFA